jgi:hypothetical protein
MNVKCNAMQTLGVSTCIVQDPIWFLPSRLRKTGGKPDTTAADQQFCRVSGTRAL